MVEITEVRIYKAKDAGSLLAYSTITLDDSFVVHGLKVMDGESGPWVSMPASKNKKGEFKDIFHPISKEAREQLIKAVIDAYEKESGS